MNSTRREQRHPYKGTPERSWIKVKLMRSGLPSEEIEVVADTGSPFALVVSTVRLARFARRDGPTIETDFGYMNSGWLKVAIPAVELTPLVLGYASDEVVRTVKADFRSFDGLVGLPLLRLMEYGGDRTSFWVKPQ